MGKDIGKDGVGADAPPGLDRTALDRVLASAELKAYGVMAPRRRALVLAWDARAVSDYDPHRW